MFAQPQAEHQWLAPLVGDWNVESECKMGPDQPPQKNTGRVTCRILGGLWLIAEGTTPSPEGGEWNSIITLGYDPKARRYVGTFVASMMTYLWQYVGSVDESGRRLILDAEGPSFDQTGMAKYQDIIEIVSDDHWILSSQILGTDGQWLQFMTAHHRRRT